MTAIGFGDLSAGGLVTHRIAINTWQGAGVPPKPPEMAGLDHFTLRYDTRERLNDVLHRFDDVETHGDASLVHDPDGNANRPGGELMSDSCLHRRARSQARSDRRTANRHGGDGEPDADR